ncbi:MAG: glycoside hydrolase family 5 protein [Acidimicrobiales bacterium]
MKRFGISSAFLMVLAVLGGLVILPSDAAVTADNSAALGIVVTVDKLTPGADGWLELADGSKQWINSSCRDKLEADGTAVEVMSWSRIAKMPDRPYRSCSQVSTSGRPTKTDLGIVVTADKQTPGSDGWLELADGSKQWVSSSCRAELEADGLSVEVMSWSEIAKMPDRPYRPCSQLRSDRPPASSTTTALSIPETTTTKPSNESTTTTQAPASTTSATDPKATTTAPSTTSTTARATTTTKKPSKPTSSAIGSGVNYSSGEYWCVSGYDVFEHEIPDAQIAKQMADLGVETVRLPLNEHCWLGDGFGYIKPHLRGEAYRSRVAEFVGVLNGHGMKVVLDLHWNAPAGQEARGQKNMADADHAIDFWTSVASRFKSNPNVIFDVYNEPHSISWQCWRDGCSSAGWQVAGMQSLVDAVRRTGATQPIILNGLDWGGDLRGWLDHVPNDPQNNLIAGFHAYNKIHDPNNVWHKRCANESCWSNELRSIKDAGYGVVIGEAGQDVGVNGCATGFLKRLFTWADQNGIPYLAWSYNPHGCSSPALLTSYDGSLTPAGQVLASHLK